jgi:hypothetical protein
MREMQLERALQIAEREWEGIRISLEKCGDIGEFLANSSARGKPAIHSVSRALFLVSKLIGMDNKLPANGYNTPEAAYIFTKLGTKAAKRLGLINGFAKSFGVGYSWIRTGWFYPSVIESEHLVDKSFFITIFLPLGSFLQYDYNSPVLKTKLKTILYKFTTWQDNPDVYNQYVLNYNYQQESTWSDLLSVTDSTFSYLEKVNINT